MTSNIEIDSVLWAQEEAEDRRLFAESRRIQQGKQHYSSIEDNEITPWLKHTKWPALFQDRPLDILTASTLQPAARCNDDYYLERWSGTPFTSPAANEAKLRLLMHSVNKMFVRAEETLAHTHYRLRCWLQTYHQRHSTYSF
jgi:hypothetical protein